MTNPQKEITLYVVSSALIALNAIFCLSLAFGLGVRNWYAVVGYTTGFVTITTTYNVWIRAIHQKAVRDERLERALRHAKTELFQATVTLASDDAPKAEAR